MTDQEDNLTRLLALAQALGVDLQRSNISVVTPTQVGKVRTIDGSLEATLYPNHLLEIETPLAGVGIQVELIDRSAPLNRSINPEALYAITFYKPELNEKGLLPGRVYVGLKGIVTP